MNVGRSYTLAPVSYSDDILPKCVNIILSLPKMRILSYKVHSPHKEGQCFSPVTFDVLNLIVGDSGMGKTQFLNTIFNAGRSAIKKQVMHGCWKIEFEHLEQTYCWQLESSTSGQISSEKIERFAADGAVETLVERTADLFIFEGKKLPRLSREESCISILQEEDAIHPIMEGFSSIFRRNFSGKDLDVATQHYVVAPDAFAQYDKGPETWGSLGLSLRLYLLSKRDKSQYEQICEEFKRIFPFVNKTGLRTGSDYSMPENGISPVFSLQEKNMTNWVPLWLFSSGMKKVLLLLTDIALMPEHGGVYLIDEYENSLGVSAINLFPSSLLEFGNNSQFIITSHHPYIIKQIPVRNWLIFYRKGSKVQIKPGNELEARLSKSKQDTFIQLLNDPFYNEGIE